MKEILKRCKCGVYLEVNKHRDYYDTIENAIDEENDMGSDPRIDGELKERMIREGEFYRLQFYPDTPVGFYVVYGTSLDEVVEKAKEILSD